MSTHLKQSKKPKLTYRVTYKKLPKAANVTMKDYTGTHLAYEIFLSTDTDNTYLKVMSGADVVYMTHLSRVLEIELIGTGYELRAVVDYESGTV